VNCYPFIEAEKAGRRNVSRACALLKVSRAAFYAHLAGPPKRSREGAELTEQIQAVHQESKGRYGAPRVRAELARRGRRHSRKRIARLMRTAGIRGRAPKRWKKTTIADPAAAARADRIRRDFTADASKVNARWCGDITYIGTWEGWLYLATVIDIASRRVVGYALADHLRTELVSAALANAVPARGCRRVRRTAVGATRAAARRPGARAIGAAIDAAKDHSHALVTSTQEVCPACTATTSHSAVAAAVARPGSIRQRAARR
jgi:transposase InsO family protein